MTDTPQRKYLGIVAHYEGCLDRHGDTHLGVDWPKADDAAKRYRVMLDVIRSPRPDAVELLDFGCGAGHLYDHLLRDPLPGVRYQGLDLSEKFVGLCRSKYPDVPFVRADVLDGDPVPACDYAVMNGVFTEKRELSFAEMSEFFRTLLRRVFEAARIGVAFNVMSKQVDWERDDLFHLPLDDLATFLTRDLTRNFVIRNDYGLYEYTTYLYKSAR